MNKTLLTISALAILIFSGPAHAGTIGFSENKGQVAGADGQTAGNVLYRANLQNAPGVFVTDKGLTYLFLEEKKETSLDPNAEPVRCDRNWSRVDMVLENASITKGNAVVEMEEPGYSNYYLPQCPQGVLYVKSYHILTFKNVYPGIDWSLKINEHNKMEYDFIVHPGADPSLIKISYKGADQMKLSDEAGKLRLISSCGDFFEGELYSYQKENNSKVNSQFRRKGNSITFALGVYDKSKTLVIDPPLNWSATQAGSGSEYAYAIALAKDGTNQTCVAGTTDSPDFPTLNAYQGVFGGNEDIFVQRLSTTGAKVWSTYYGGTGYDGGKGIGTDASGNCYVGGYTGSSNFPVLTPVQTNYGGGTYDIAILKFNAAGVRQWATWYGGINTDFGTALASDNNGTIYITGYTTSNNFPLVNAISTGSCVATDAFIMKMKANQTVRWADFFGGNDDDRGRAVTVNASGSAMYFAGSSLSSNLITTTGVFQPSNASAFNYEDGFITRFDTSGQSVTFSTFCGGSDADFIQGIAVDASGKIFVTGYTLSADFPIKNPGFVAYCDSTQGSPGTHDAFVVACNANATQQLWGTYLGGTGVDMGLGITASSTGIFVTGAANSTDLSLQQPMDNQYFQATQGDGGSFNDFFLAWFYTNYSRQWCTYYGGVNNDEGFGTCTDANGNIYFAGEQSNDALISQFGPGVLNSVNEVNAEMRMNIFPQPAGNELHLTFNCSGEQAGQLVILNALGEQVSLQKTETHSGANEVIADITTLAPGIYFAVLKGGTSDLRQRFVKK